LVHAGGTISFVNLFAKSESIAHELQLNEADRRPVAYVAHNDVTVVALTLALFERGIPAFPLNPRASASDQVRLVDYVRARLLDVGKTLRLRDAPTSPTRHLAMRNGTESPQLLVASSGSTGSPKIVCLSARALSAAAVSAHAHLRMTNADRWLLSLSLGHIGGVAILVRCLLARATLVLAEPSLNSQAFAACLDAHRPTLASLVPTQLQRLLAAGAQPGSLRAVLLGGARSPFSLLKQARAAGWPVLATYGMSESGAQVSTQPLSDLSRAEVLDDVGHLLSGVELRFDASGRICLRGACLFDGYFGRSDSPFDAEGWFITEDFGTLNEHGRLVPLGRAADWITTGGETVSSLEIEAELMTVPGVRAAAVVALPDPEWGQVVAAAVVLEVPADWSQELPIMKSELSKRLAAYKLPKHWLQLPELPQLPNGKLDRLAVRARFGRG
jgi:O-succinylbenzoic acid--CoA ligase